MEFIPISDGQLYRVSIYSFQFVTAKPHLNSFPFARANEIDGRVIHFSL